MNYNKPSTPNLDFPFGMLVGLFLGLLILAGMLFANDTDWKNSAIEAGAGEYDSKTGMFKFIIIEDIKRVEVDE